MARGGIGLALLVAVLAALLFNAAADTVTKQLAGARANDEAAIGNIAGRNKAGGMGARAASDLVKHNPLPVLSQVRGKSFNP